MTNELLSRLKDSVLIADGGMGTMVQELSPAPVECVEEINLSNPELVREIHRQFISAGAVIIETNTFGANRFALEKFRLDGKTTEINTRAVEIAKSVARPCSRKRMTGTTKGTRGSILRNRSYKKSRRRLTVCTS